MARVEVCQMAMSSSHLPAHLSPDDAALLAAYVKQRDQAKLGALFQRHADAAYRVAWRVCGNSADAEDAVQAAFLQVVQQASQFRGGATVRGWIMSIVINCCRMRQRHDSQRRKREELHPAPHYISAGGAVDESAQNRELASAAIGAVKRLPEHYRLPVWLHYVEGLSYQEAASALTAKEKTVREQARRGIEQIREALLSAGFTASLAAVPQVLAAVHLPAAPLALKTALSTLAMSSAGKSSALAAVSKGNVVLAGKAPPRPRPPPLSSPAWAHWR